MKKSSNVIEEAAASEDRAHADLKAAPPAAGTFQARMIALKKIKPSPTNPRKHFDKEAQVEMEASMRAHGFTLSTLLVRPWPAAYRIDAVQEDQFFVMETPAGGIEHALGMHTSREEAEKQLAEFADCFEIVAGERRWRAATAANIAEAPCIVRELSDREVVEQQLVENLQRKDLTPMETALGFGTLIGMKDAAGNPIHTTKTLHEKTGMSVRFIERHLRLRVIAEDKDLAEFRTAFEQGIVGFFHALHVARLPDPKLRVKLAKEILAPKYEESPLSVRRVEQLVQRDYMVDLRNAGFELKDQQLLGIRSNAAGERLSGGACTDCPFRLGNSPETFEGAVPSALANMCMNPSCFETKRELGWKKWQEAETDEKKKRRAVSERECKALFAHGDQLCYGSAFVLLSDRPDSDDLKPGAESPGTWRSLVKGKELEILVAKDRNGKTHELVNRELALQAAELNGHKIFKAAKKEKPGTDDQRREQLEENSRKVRLEREILSAEEKAVAEAVFAKASKAKKAPAGFWPVLMQQFAEQWDFEEIITDIEEHHAFPESGTVQSMAKLPEDQQFALVVEMIWRMGVRQDGQSLIGKLFEVEEKAIRKEAAATAKTEQKKRGDLIEKIRAAATMAKMKDKQLDEMAQGFGAEDFASLRDLEALMQILNSIVKEGGAPVDERLLARARKLRASGKGKSTGALADELKIDAVTAGRLVDALVDEKHDAKEGKLEPDRRVSAAKGPKAKKGGAK